MKTQTQILTRAQSSTSFLGFDVEVYAEYLDAEHVGPLLKSPEDAKGWTHREPTPENVRADIAEYMEFAWGKVETHRGISATRSVEKIAAYLWVLGDDETLAAMQAAEYAPYGAPKLRAVCERLGLPMPGTPEITRMADGLPCVDGCDEGCGV